MNGQITRRRALTILGGLAVSPLAVSAGYRSKNRANAADAAFVPPVSPRETYSFNPGWKFIRQDVPGAEAVAFDDSAWSPVSTPHTWNDTDSYNAIISHSGGDRRAWTGIAWYRKRFKLPASASSGKVFLELEGLKQAGHFWVNGKFVGLYENGVTAYGLDLTNFVKFGDAENVIAVKADNSNDYQEESSHTGYEWMGRAFNPNYGGLNHDINLHVTGKVYQTLPLNEGLKTSGVYIYPTNFAIAARTCDVTVEAQVRNESGDQQSITLSAVVVDQDGNIRAKLAGDTTDLVSGQTEIINATGSLSAGRFWSPDDPYLYDVYSILTVGGKAVDVVRTRTGFRKTEFKGGAGTGGVWLNDKFVYLKGYSQRSSDDWAGLGEAYPDWMHDYNAKLLKSTNGNYVRWMHIAPQAVDVRSCDKTGICIVVPAGDKEKDAQGRQWEQRVEVMRDTMIYFRNNPSVLFWEAGNTVVTADHMRQIVELRKEWDPNGGRVAGTRGDGNDTANTALTSVAEYYGVMIGQDRRTDQLTGQTAMFRAYSAARRDRAPLIETEDFRDESARRFWDDYSPPHFGFKPGPNDTYHWTSESFALAAAERYYAYERNMISNTDPAHAKWSGYASIYWSDSNADGRQDSSEVARVSGKVDSVRLPKEAYYVYRVMQSTTPDIHIIGHWTYPPNTKKTVYVAASYCDAVELTVNGKQIGKVTAPVNGFIYPFPDVAFVPGTIKAVSYSKGNVVGSHALTTAGPPARIKLTPITGPAGFLADGADVTLIDFEVVDAKGQRCSTDEARVDFAVTGPIIWRGGYNSGIPGSINNKYLLTECGINRVAIRSTMTPGVATVTATRTGLASGVLQIESKPVAIRSGLIASVERVTNDYLMATTNWQQVTAENKPWTRWWWLGSALSEAEITRDLEIFHKAGIGGVEVSPIYGAKGFEDRYVAYLSDRWVDLLAFTLREAERLGMGVDMILGTGWPYGGPWVPDTDSPQRMYWETVPAGADGPEIARGRQLLATSSAPDAKGNRIALAIGPTGQKVKRAAPGGEGNVLDHFSAQAVRDYIAAFDKPLSRLPAGSKLRCVFNDSYEVFGANATPDLLAEFSKRRGYDLAEHLPALQGDGDAETVSRVRSDYRETIGDLVQDAFLGQWTAWARTKGSLTRNQAHGSPGNLLDLYAIADIPETEVFGPARLKQGGLEAYHTLPPDFGDEEEPLICRMASSAAHVAGRLLCSSESFTWLGEHGCVPLEHAKAEVDTLFTLGINHIFFHGTPFSPADVEWPGWLFYASTHMAPTNPWWPVLSTLNTYIARCQSYLQAGRPDNDLLFYLPFYDLIASDKGAVDGLQFMTVGRTRAYLTDNIGVFTKTADDLTRGGWSFDMVSDRQLEDNVHVDANGIQTTGGSRYQAILIAGCSRMTPKTAERLLALAGAGATILILGDFPADVPGLNSLSERHERLQRAWATLGSADSTDPRLRQYMVGKGRVVIGDDLARLMEEAEIAPEAVAGHGIEYIRRVDSKGLRTYFLASPGREDWRGWAPLTKGFGAAVQVLDPMSGEEFRPARRTNAQGQMELDLSLPAGGSLILRMEEAIAAEDAALPPSRQVIAASDGDSGHEIAGPWHVEFIDGGPSLPAPRALNRLSDWTTWTGSDSDTLRAFSGTARFTCRFDRKVIDPAGVFLDLGQVCHSAQVRLNGADIRALIARPWRIHIPAAALHPNGNTLEIEVTNLMANRLSDLERRKGDAWRPFLMVNIAYKPFDAATWEPLPSGLLGPVKLVGARFA